MSVIRKSMLRWCLALFLAYVLSACGTPGPAPIASRDYPVKTKYKKIKLSGYYRVQPGDTLYSIAWRTGFDYRRLAVWNGIRAPYTIFSGQTLRLSPPKMIDSSHSRGRDVKMVPNKALVIPHRARSTANKPLTGLATSIKKKPTKAPMKKVATAPTKKPVKAPTYQSAHQPAAVHSSKSLQWQWPTQGPLLTTFASSNRARQGIKIKGRFGQSIRAAEAGQVVYQGSGLLGYGRLIIVKHKKDFLSAYGFNRKILVKEGDKVTKGEQIAEMGKSADGQPALHFEIRRQGMPVDPVSMLPRRN